MRVCVLKKPVHAVDRTITRATVLMSGGIDSAACTHHFRSRGMTVDGIFIDYGQAASESELRAAKGMADHFDIYIHYIKIQGFENAGPGELLGRNGLLVFASLFATKGKSALIGIGVHEGTPYYDCSSLFVANMNRLVMEHTDGRVTLSAPFVAWTKKDIFDYFTAANLPLELTYSCEAGTEPTCGVCASCQDRRALGC